MKEEDQDRLDIVSFTYQLYFKAILFATVILVFIAFAVVFLVMAIKEYDWKLVAAVGASDTIFALVILHITKSLFKITRDSD